MQLLALMHRTSEWQSSDLNSGHQSPFSNSRLYLSQMGNNCHCLRK